MGAETIPDEAHAAARDDASQRYGTSTKYGGPTRWRGRLQRPAGGCSACIERTADERPNNGGQPAEAAKLLDDVAGASPGTREAFRPCTQGWWQAGGSVHALVYCRVSGWISKR